MGRIKTKHIVDCDCLECFGKFDHFSLLSEDALEILHQNKRVVNYKPGDIIVRQGDIMADIVAIFSGYVKVYLAGVNGYQLIFQLMKRGDMVLGPGLYTDYKYHYSVSAISKSKMILFDLDLFLDAMQQNRDFAKHCHKTENLQKIKLFDKFVNLTQKQMTGRIADVLLYLNESIYKANPFKMHISRSELGDMTALCKESTTRVLRQLENDGIIDLQGKRVEILDKQALKYYSEIG